MTEISAYVGVLVLVYCTFQPMMTRACSDCPCCSTDYQQCFNICVDPSQCTTCMNKKEECEKQYCTVGKRNSADWALKARPDPMSVPDHDGNLPLSDKKELTLKSLLSGIIAKREKNSRN